MFKISGFIESEDELDESMWNFCLCDNNTDEKWTADSPEWLDKYAEYVNGAKNLCMVALPK